jgi:hypothetical protein
MWAVTKNTAQKGITPLAMIYTKILQCPTLGSNVAQSGGGDLRCTYDIEPTEVRRIVCERQQQFVGKVIVMDRKLSQLKTATCHQIDDLLQPEYVKIRRLIYPTAYAGCAEGPATGLKELFQSMKLCAP